MISSKKEHVHKNKSDKCCVAFYFCRVHYVNRLLLLAILMINIWCEKSITVAMMRTSHCTGKHVLAFGHSQQYQRYLDCSLGSHGRNVSFSHSQSVTSDNIQSDDNYDDNSKTTGKYGEVWRGQPGIFFLSKSDVNKYYTSAGHGQRGLSRTM